MRYSRRAVIGVSVAAGLLGVGSVALILSSPQTHAEGTFALRGVYAAFLLLIGWGFAGTGLYAWSRRPANAIGPLMTATGLAWLLRGHPWNARDLRAHRHARQQRRRLQFGTGMTSAPAGSSQGLYLVVDDVAAARVELVERGAEVSEVYHERGPVTRSRFDASASPGRVPGRDPEGSSYASFASFSDPDGNGWILQEITSRLPGRLGGALDTSDLAELLRDVEQHHGDYEPTAPKHHWYDWYASYIVAREHGRTADEAVREATLH